MYTCTYFPFKKLFFTTSFWKFQAVESPEIHPIALSRFLL